MNYFKYSILILAIILVSATGLKSNPPMGRTFGAGIMIGEPTGLTAKIWASNSEAFAISVGNSYLGNLRIGVDYLWHFNAFNSQVVSLYAGPGVAVGIGESGSWWYRNENKTWYKEPNDIGFGVRGLFGINIIPRSTPLEFFGEIGVMVGVLPATHTNAEGAIGFGFYF